MHIYAALVNNLIVFHNDIPQQSLHSGPPASPGPSPKRRVVTVNVVKRLGGSAVGHSWPLAIRETQQNYVRLAWHLFKRLDWEEMEEQGQR